MKRFCFVLAGILILAAIAVAPAHAGKKDDTLVWATGAITLLALIWAIRQHNLIASPKLTPGSETKEGAPPVEDLARLVSEARREIG